MTGAPWSSGFGVVDGTRLHYQRTGGPSPVIVLLHGLADDGLCWIRVARRLEQTFDVVMPDARGHGQSDPIGSGGFSVPRLVADAAGLLDLLGIRNALLFGHSMGAITAAVLAADRPDLVRGLVLEDPPLDVPVPSPDDRRTRMRSDVGSWRDLTPAMRRKRVAEIHPGWARAETHPWLEAEVNVDLDVFDHLELFDDIDWRTTLARLEVPGLLVTGDPVLGALITDRIAREAVGCWTGGTRLHVADAGHSIHRDQWAASMGPIERFLRKPV